MAAIKTDAKKRKRNRKARTDVSSSSSSSSDSESSTSSSTEEGKADTAAQQPKPSKKDKSTLNKDEQDSTSPPLTANSDAEDSPSNPDSSEQAATTASIASRPKDPEQLFDAFYLQQATREFANDLDTLRSAGDFTESSVGVLIGALRQGRACFSAEERRKIVSKGLEGEG